MAGQAVTCLGFILYVGGGENVCVIERLMLLMAIEPRAAQFGFSSALLPNLGKINIGQAFRMTSHNFPTATKQSTALMRGAGIKSKSYAETRTHSGKTLWCKTSSDSLWGKGLIRIPFASPLQKPNPVIPNNHFTSASNPSVTQCACTKIDTTAQANREKMGHWHSEAAFPFNFVFEFQSVTLEKVTYRELAEEEGGKKGGRNRGWKCIRLQLHRQPVSVALRL